MATGPLPAADCRPAGTVLVPWSRADPRIATAAGYPETDLGLAERFALWCGQHWRYRPGHGWLRYDGTRWVLDQHGHVIDAELHQVVRAVTELETLRIGAGSDLRTAAARERRRRWGRACETPTRMDAALRLARALPGLCIPEDSVGRRPLRGQHPLRVPAPENWRCRPGPGRALLHRPHRRTRRPDRDQPGAARGPDPPSRRRPERRGVPGPLVRVRPDRVHGRRGVHVHLRGRLLRQEHPAVGVHHDDGLLRRHRLPRRVHPPPHRRRPHPRADAPGRQTVHPHPRGRRHPPGRRPGQTDRRRRPGRGPAAAPQPGHLPTHLQAHLHRQRPRPRPGRRPGPTPPAAAAAGRRPRAPRRPHASNTTSKRPSPGGPRCWPSRSAAPPPGSPTARTCPPCGPRPRSPPASPTTWPRWTPWPTGGPNA